MLRRFPHNLRKFVSDMDLLVYNSDIQNLIEILKNHLYFAILTPGVQLKNTTETLFFNVDDEFVYMSYYFDFGPHNLSSLYKYCCKVNRYLYGGEHKRIVHCTSTDPYAKANAAFLIGCFAVIYLQVSPDKMAKALVSGCERFLPFADASIYGSNWKITLLDCFWAVKKAYHFGFFNFSDFDAYSYDTYNKLQNGDLNWVLPGKFVAFVSPSDMQLPNFHPPEFYIQYFMNHDVKAVIRLNNETYDSSVFSSVGIEHYELFFPDGTTPPKHVLTEFLRISETTPGAIAIHCKAGLGRTGSLIGAYLIKHYTLHAREAIAWLRMCRPGSVIGGQQGWLETMEPYFRRQGYHYRFETYGNCDKILRFKYGVYSKQWALDREKMMKIVKAKALENATELYMNPNIHAKLPNSHYEKQTAVNYKPNTLNPKSTFGITGCNYHQQPYPSNGNVTQGERLISIKARDENANTSAQNSQKIAGNSMKTNAYFSRRPGAMDNLSRRK